MIFALWFSLNHILIKYRGPIKKTSHLRPIYLSFTKLQALNHRKCRYREQLHQPPPQSHLLLYILSTCLQSTEGMNVRVARTFSESRALQFKLYISSKLLNLPSPEKLMIMFPTCHQILMNLWTMDNVWEEGSVHTDLVHGRICYSMSSSCYCNVVSVGVLQIWKSFTPGTNGNVNSISLVKLGNRNQRKLPRGLQSGSG